MGNKVIEVNSMSKAYRLGVINHGMLYKDIQSWIARKRGKEDPHSKLDMYNSEQLDGDDRFWALRDVDFTVKQGDRVGIIGKNGAGKSTLLKILSRVTTPTRGEVKIKGRISSLLEVGTGFHPELTGRENVYLNGAILGMTKHEIKSKFDEIVDFSGVEKFIETPVKRYSSGMYVRLAFAVAAHLNPDILIVDEVLAVGDSEFQKKALGKMEEVSKGEGRTILLVSHNMAAIQKMCESAMVLKNGIITYMGKSEEAVNKYLVNNIQSASSYTDLQTTERYDGSPQRIATWISLHKLNGEESDEFIVGETIIIRLGYNLQSPIAAYCQINFLNYIGDRVMTVHSKHTAAQLSLSGKGYIECVLSDIRLLSGEYTICLEIGRQSPFIEWLDFIPEAIRMKISNGDYLGGVEWISSPGHGTIAQQSKWQLIKF